MSLTTAARHPQSEPSPPTSPNPAQRDASVRRKEPAAKRLPESPPASASPSPAHMSTLQPSTVSVSTTQTMAPTATSTIFSSHLAPSNSEASPDVPLSGSSLSRTSSKHRLDEDEDGTTEPNKRRRTDRDRNESQKAMEAVESGSHSIFSATLHRLSDQPVPRSRPHPTQDLFDLYGLNKLANTVRRKDTATGEKINKLRKSYESKIKEFSGKNKPVIIEGEFFYLLNYPDEEWGISQHNGKEIPQALSVDGQQFSDIMGSKVDAAISAISRAPLSKAERDKWRSALDLESAAPKSKIPDAQAASRQAQPNTTTQPTMEGVRRPKRRGTKRNYNDEAFEGYNEGFVDDNLDLSGDGDDDRRSSLSTGSRKRQRRLKDPGPASNFPGTTPQWAVSVGGRGR